MQAHKICAVEEDGLFNEYSRRNRPLSLKMRSHSDRLRNHLNSAPLKEVAAFAREQVEDAVASVRCKPTSLGEPTSGWGGPGMPRGYWLAFPLLESEDFVYFWPDKIDGISPIDANDAAKADEWRFGYVEGSPTGVGIITSLDLSRTEHEAERSNPTVQKRLAERMGAATRYVEALAQQMLWFFDEALIDLGMEIVAERKLNLSIVESLAFPSSWKIPEPALVGEAGAELTIQTTSDSGYRANEGPAATKPDQSPVGEYAVPYRKRLDPASFEDVQRVMRLWANSIERYPDAFAELSEDRVSDLLAATLNATLPGAQREVYSRAGKSDIFIQADVLSEGAGPANIFICESKWSRGKAWVSGAVKPQLFGYLTAQDTSAVLLLLFSQKRFARARTNAYGWLKQVDGYLGEEFGAVDGWPIFLYKHMDLTVRLCVASVHIPSTS